MQSLPSEARDASDGEEDEAEGGADDVVDADRSSPDEADQPKKGDDETSTPASSSPQDELTGRGGPDLS